MPTRWTVAASTGNAFRALLAGWLSLTAPPASAWGGKPWVPMTSLNEAAPLTIEYDELLFADGDESDLQRLEARVAGHPDHPLLKVLETLRRRLENGPDRTRVRVWYASDHLFRIAHDSDVPEEMAYRDHGLDARGDAWMLFPDRLSAWDARSPPEGREADVEADNLQIVWSKLTDCMTGYFAATHWSFRDPTVHDGDWQGEVVSPDGDRTIVYAGAIDDSGHARPTESRLATWKTKPESTGGRYTFEDWRFEPVPGREIPHRVTEIAPNGRPIRQLVLHEMSAVTKADVEAMARLPDPRSPSDALRDLSLVTRINDQRHDRDTTAMRSDRGFVAVPSPHAQRDFFAVWAQRAGWALVIVIVVFLVAVRIRRGVHGA